MTLSFETPAPALAPALAPAPAPKDEDVPPASNVKGRRVRFSTENDVATIVPCASYEDYLYTIGQLHQNSLSSHVPKPRQVQAFLIRGAQAMGYIPKHYCSNYENEHNSTWRQSSWLKIKQPVLSDTDVLQWRRIVEYDWTQAELVPDQRRDAKTKVNIKIDLTYVDPSSVRKRVSTFVAALFCPAETTVEDEDERKDQVKDAPDLNHVTDIINSCVNFGNFQFTSSMLLKFCAQPIKTAS